MQNSIRDAFMIALKQKGYSLNTSDPEELAQAKRYADRTETPCPGLCYRPGKR